MTPFLTWFVLEVFSNARECNIVTSEVGIHSMVYIRHIVFDVDLYHERTWMLTIIHILPFLPTRLNSTTFTTRPYRSNSNLKQIRDTPYLFVNCSLAFGCVINASIWLRNWGFVYHSKLSLHGFKRFKYNTCDHFFRRCPYRCHSLSYNMARYGCWRSDTSRGYTLGYQTSAAMKHKYMYIHSVRKGFGSICEFCGTIDFGTSSENIPSVVPPPPNNFHTFLRLTQFGGYWIKQTSKYLSRFFFHYHDTQLRASHAR